MSTQTSATVKETAAALRKALKAAHPETKFSVRMATGTAYGWLRVAWTDGPTATQVDEIIKPFVSRRFDGMDDAYHATGVTEWSCCGVNTTRTLSPEAVEQALSLVEHTVDGEPLIQRGDVTVVAHYPYETDEDIARRWLAQQAA